MGNNNTDRSREIRDCIQKLANTYGYSKVKIFDAEVISVDEETRTCIVDSVDSKMSLDGIKVRFMLEQSDGDMGVPEIGSTVTVAMNDFTEPYITSKTFLAKKLLVVGNQSHLIVNDKQQLNDGKLGGIPISKEVAKYIKDLEDKLNDHIQNWNSFCSQYVPGSPATTGLPASLAAFTSTKVTEFIDEKKISNENITHGYKNSSE